MSEAARAFAEATTDYELLLDSIARVLTARVGDGCGVFLRHEDPNLLRTVAMHTADPHRAADSMGLFKAEKIEIAKHEWLRRTLETGQSLRLSPVETARRSSETPARYAAAEAAMGLHSVLMLPLRGKSGVLGVLALGRYLPESPPYDQHDQDLAELLAAHAAVAIENAQLYHALEEARQAAERAEERARASEQSHRFLFAASPVPTVVLDLETHHILAANTAAAELYGYSAQEFLSLSLDDLRFPEDREDLAAAWRPPPSGLWTATVRHRRKDGTAIFAEGKSLPFVYEGRACRFTAIQDRTERVRAEAARREVEERLQRTLDTMMEGYAIIDRELRYLYVNEAAARQARVPRERLIGRRLTDVHPGFESSPAYPLALRCLHERVPYQFEGEITLMDGTQGHFEVRGRPIPEGLVALTVDVTERWRAEQAREALEEQLRQSQRMDAVGRLAGGIAHDFNNILSIILGYGEALLEDIDAADPRHADAQEIHKAASRASDLVRQLLMFSRQQLVEPKVLSLNDVIGGLQRMLPRLLGEHIEVVTRLDPALGRVRADRGNIEQVIMNLVVNAKDAMPTGGTLTLETRNVTLDADFARAHGAEPGEYVLLEVTDTGVGMDKETRLRAFEPFFTTKEHGKGTGLGLSTVFGIVRQCHGGVRVHSEPARGATFEVCLPRTDAAVDFGRSTRPRPRRAAPATILLVEDEDGVRAVAQRMLERQGYRVLSARDGAEALQIAESTLERIDLLLTDVVMPRMSGGELATLVAARWPHIRVLYVSGYTDGTVAAHGVFEEGVAFLQKPFTSEQLARKVRSVLEAGISERPPAI